MGDMIQFLFSVCLQMSFEIIILYEPIITLITFNWFHASGYFHMHFKIIFLRESLEALSTFIWFLSIVYSQITSNSKAFFTIGTLILFILSVYIQMYFKITIIQKLFCTIATLIRFIPSMSSKMLCQLVSFYLV